MSLIPHEHKPDLPDYAPRRNKYPPPEVGIFESPTRSVCVNEQWIPFINGVLAVLESAQYWDGDWQRAEEEIIKLEAALMGDPEIGSGCGGEFEDIDEFCNEYASDSFIITYAPNDPFQTPDLSPDPYQSPPWVRVTEAGTLFPSTQLNDALVGLWSVPVDFGDWLSNPLALLSAGLPRFRVRFSGQGVIELHLLTVPQGGMAVVTIDDEPTSARFLTMESVGLTELEGYVTTLLNAIADILPDGTGGIDGENLIDVKILEIPITTDGEHHIDVTFLPFISDDVVFGFGGGLRKVVLCRENITGVENQMPQFRVSQENFNVEWKPNALTEIWEPIGQVIYPITMRVEPDPETENPTFQYTLQGIPIGGGADPFTDWRDLIEVQAGEQGETPQLRLNSETEQPFVEWKLPSESEWTPLFDVPLGIEDVLIEPLPAGSPPFADLTDTTLTLNLPTPLNGNSPLMRVSDNVVQYAISSDENNNPEWINLFELSDLAFQAVWIEAEPAGSEPFTSIFENELTLHLPEAEMVQLRSNETHIQWSYVRELPEDEVWTDLIELVTLKGADGIDGTNGIDGTDGIDGADGDRILHVIANTLSAGSSANANYDALSKTLYLGIPRGNTGLDGECDCDEPSVPYNAGVSNAIRRCNVAIGITTWLFNTFQAAVEACEGLTSDAEALTALFGVVEQSKWNSSLLADLANRLRLSDSVTIAALMTETAKENWQKWYNCNGATDGILDPTVWGQYIAQREGILGASAAALLYEDFLLALKTSEVNNQAAIASYETGDCSELSCEWCYTINFNGVNPEYTIVKGIQEASHLRTDFAFYGNESYRFWQVEIPIAASATVTKVTVNHDHTLGTFDPVSGSGSSWGVTSYTSGNTVQFFDKAALPEPYEWEGERNASTKLWFYCLVGTERLAGQNANGESLLQSITIWGTGANPFGGDNC